MTLPLILLPGLMCDARLFAPQIAELSRRGSVVVGDICAHNTVEALAGAVLDDAPPQFALGGLSMGGIVAMEIVRQAPHRVLKLALIDTNPKAEAATMQARRGPQIAKARQGHLAQVLREEMKPNYLTQGPQRASILDLCMAMALDLGSEVFERQSVALRDRPDQQNTLRRVTVPTLVLCGREDALCPVEHHLLMHGLVAGSELEIVDGAGHLPTLEQPKQTTAALCRWMEE